jgi:protein ImuB
VKIACVDVPALPLQLAWQRQPAWRAYPSVVVDEDRPGGRVSWACPRARAAHILPGHQYSHALSLCDQLRAQVVSPMAIVQATDRIAQALHEVSPGVQRVEHQPGTFWLDGSGLERLFAGAQPAGVVWGEAAARVLARLGFDASVVVGFSRFATCAVARSMGTGVKVFDRDSEERAVARAVALDRLELPPRLRDSLARLGVTTVGQMVALPGGGILERFGKEAHQLYQLAAGEKWDPLVPEPPPECPFERVLLDDDEHDLERLLFAIKAAVDRLLQRLAGQVRAVTTLYLELSLRFAVGDVRRRCDCLKPAAPTLEVLSLLRLVRLRLEGQPPEVGVVELKVWADSVLATREQLALFGQRPRRDLRAAEDAIAQVRAELGDHAVVTAVLKNGHLPEASFAWERFARMKAPGSRRQTSMERVALARPLVRRLLVKPERLAPRSAHVRDDGWLLAGMDQGAVTQIHGPYVISGGWWAHEIHREYHFAELRRGDCLWVYFDRIRRCWFLHGMVE